MSVSASDLLIFASASMVMSIFSGISGGGGGFVMTPLLIALGLSPAQAVATGKIMGVSVATGSLHGMRSIKPSSKKRVLIVMIMALVAGLVAPFFIKGLDSQIYRTGLGVLLLLMIPVLIYKKVGLHAHQPTPWQLRAGYICLIFALMFQGIFGGGIGTLVNVVLMGLLGMPALEANVTKRYSQVLMNVVILLGVLFAGLIVWQIALVGLFTAFTGGMIGSRIAIKKGNKLVMYVTIGLMALSGLWLIFG